MSSKVAEADRYLKTQQQDNETQEETHTLTVQYSIIQQLQPPDFYFPTPNRFYTSVSMTGYEGFA